MSLNGRLARLEDAVWPEEPVEWTSWEQDEEHADLFHQRGDRGQRTGETALRFQVGGRPRCTWTEYTDDHDGSGTPATIVHGPGYVRRYIGVGRPT